MHTNTLHDKVTVKDIADAHLLFTEVDQVCQMHFHAATVWTHTEQYCHYK